MSTFVNPLACEMRQRDATTMISIITILHCAFETQQNLSSRKHLLMRRFHFPCVFSLFLSPGCAAHVAFKTVQNGIKPFESGSHWYRYPQKSLLVAFPTLTLMPSRLGMSGLSFVWHLLQHCKEVSNLSITLLDSRDVSLFKNRFHFSVKRDSTVLILPYAESWRPHLHIIPKRSV